MVEKMLQILVPPPRYGKTLCLSSHPHLPWFTTLYKDERKATAFKMLTTRTVT